MKTVLVTGATGTIGSSVCQLLVDRGMTARALVRRPGPNADALRDIGVEVVAGDLTDPSDVRCSLAGVDGIVHSAATKAGAASDRETYEAVNVLGTRNVLNAAIAEGSIPVTALGTTSYFDTSTTLTEWARLTDEPVADPYTLTKRQAHRDVMSAAADGLRATVVIAGATFGPAGLAERSMQAPSFNQRLVDGIEGDLDAFPSFPVPWTYTRDVAWLAVAALEHGTAGGCYLGFGRPESVMSTAAWINVGCEIEGVSHRVKDLSGDDLDDPTMAGVFNETLVAMAKKTWPEPYFTYGSTVQDLGYKPTALVDAMADTIVWLRKERLLAE